MAEQRQLANVAVFLPPCKKPPLLHFLDLLLKIYVLADGLNCSIFVVGPFGQANQSGHSATAIQPLKSVFCKEGYLASKEPFRQDEGQGRNIAMKRPLFWHVCEPLSCLGTHEQIKNPLFAQVLDPNEVNLSGFAQVKGTLFSQVYEALGSVYM